MFISCWHQSWYKFDLIFQVAVSYRSSEWLGWGDWAGSVWGQSDQLVSDHPTACHHCCVHIQSSSEGDLQCKRCGKTCHLFTYWYESNCEEVFLKNCILLAVFDYCSNNDNLDTWLCAHCRRNWTPWWKREIWPGRTCMTSWQSVYRSWRLCPLTSDISVSR